MLGGVAVAHLEGAAEAGQQLVERAVALLQQPLVLEAEQRLVADPEQQLLLLGAGLVVGLDHDQGAVAGPLADRREGQVGPLGGQLGHGEAASVCTRRVSQISASTPSTATSRPGWGATIGG